MQCNACAWIAVQTAMLGSDGSIIYRPASNKKRRRAIAILLHPSAQGHQFLAPIRSMRASCQRLSCMIRIPSHCHQFLDERSSLVERWNLHEKKPLGLGRSFAGKFPRADVCAFCASYIIPIPLARAVHQTTDRVHWQLTNIICRDERRWRLRLQR